MKQFRVVLADHKLASAWLNEKDWDIENLKNQLKDFGNVEIEYRTI